MSTISGEEIFARARTIASQTMTDANQSVVIDSKGGLRALLNHSIIEVYRRKANDIKFRHDITTINSTLITTGTGTVPDVLMREYLHQANISTETCNQITYFDYAIDGNSGQTYDQLGYLWISNGDVFNYRAPAPDLGNFTGDLLIECPSFPEFPMLMSTPITFPSLITINDIVLFLAEAILGKEAYQVVSV